MLTVPNSYKILFIRFSSLGDVVLSLDALRLAQMQPSNQVHILTKEAMSGLIAALVPGVVVHAIPNHASLKDLLQVIKKLSKENYNLVVDLHNNLRSHVVTTVLSKTTVRMSKERLKSTLIHFLRVLSVKLKIKIRQRAAAGVELIAPSKNISNHERLELRHRFVGQANTNEQIQKLKPNYICICSESAWAEKTWALDRFIELAKKIKFSGTDVVWLGLNSLQPLDPTSVTLDLRSKQDLVGVLSVLAGASRLICSDMGLLHLSESVGTPVTTIFGPTHPHMGFGPRLKDSTVVQSELWCRPCSKNGRFCHRLKNPRLCLDLVTKQAVELSLHY